MKHKQRRQKNTKPAGTLPPPVSRGLFWALDRQDLLPLLAVIIAAWAVQSFFINYTVDDAFISFRYSRNLADGLGLVFNPGDRVEGFTNFLWTLYCSIPFLLGMEILWFAKVSLMLLSAGVLVMAVLLVREIVPEASRSVTLIPAVLLASHTSFTVYAVNGMESMLFTFLLLLAMLLSCREFRQGGWTSAIPWGLLFLTRPDGLLFFGLVWFARLLWTDKDRSFVIWSAVVLAFVGGLTVFRLAYFGHPVPNTYYAKAAGGLADRVGRWGYRYLRDMLKIPFHWLYLLLPVVAAIVRWRKLNVFNRILVVLPFAYLAYALYIGGDINLPHFRILLHILPLMAVAALVPIASRFAPRKGQRPRKTARAIIFAVLTVLVALQLRHTSAVWKQLNRTDESPGYRYLSLFPLAGEISIYPEIAQALKSICPPGSAVVMQDVGAIPFYSDVNTIDIIGLVDAELAHYYYQQQYTDYLQSRLPVERVRTVNAWVRDYVLIRRRAEFVLYHVDSGHEDDFRYSFHWHNLAYDPRFNAHYRKVAVFRYPGTGRVDHMLFERVTSNSSAAE